MVKVLTSKQIRELDAYTIAHEPVRSVDLMERACRAFVQWYVTRFDVTSRTGIVCGTGNNGGDGLAIARMLLDWGYPVKVWIVRGSVQESADFLTNLERLSKKPVISEIRSEADQGLFVDLDVIIDAVFGSGLSRPAEGVYAQAIRCINAAMATKVAVDIPSGLMADGPSTGDIVRADMTVSFHVPKLAFFFPQSHPFCGEWTIADIGLSKVYIREAVTDFYWIQKKDAARILRPRSKFDHKGTFGHALIVAGSYGKVGAAVLASQASLRAGAGLVSVHAPGCANLVLQTAVPEAMFSADADERNFSAAPDASRYDAIGIGPGLGQAPATVAAVEQLLADFRKPVVIDADALNILAQNRELLKSIPEGSLLTPHPKEFERLAGRAENDFERLEQQRTLARSLKATVILKGGYTAIATPSGKVYFNSSGNPGMATGGTGDALTGILTALLAQHYSPEDAAILGVYLHGLAGDVAAVEKSVEGMIASDLIEAIPAAFGKISR